METIDYPFEYKVTRSGDHYIIDAQIDMSVLSLEELFWDVFAVTEKNGEEVRVSAYWSRWQRLKLLLMNYQCDVDKEHIIFPYSTITCKMAFTYRTRSKYDGFDVKIKELAAFGVYTLLLPYWKKKRVWLVFENSALWRRIMDIISSNIVWSSFQKKRSSIFIIFSIQILLIMIR